MDNDQRIIINYLLRNRDSWRTSKGLKAILADSIPDKKALRNTLIIAYEEGIFDAFKNVDDLNRTIYKYKKILIDDYAINEKVAEWAVETWLLIVRKENEDYTEFDEPLYIDEKCLNHMISKIMVLAPKNEMRTMSKLECVSITKRIIESEMEKQ